MGGRGIKVVDGAAGRAISIRKGILLGVAALAFSSAPACSGESESRDPPQALACRGKTGAAPFDGKRHVFVGLDRREYLLHVPASYDPGLAAPLVLVFHGVGGQAEQMPDLTGMSDLAGEKRFVVVYPQGNPGSEGATGWFVASGIWDFLFVEKVIEELEGEYCIDARQVHAVGHSNGGFFTYRLACEMTSRFAAFASVAGGPAPVGCNPSRPPPIAILQGAADNVVDPETTETAKDGFVEMEACGPAVPSPDGCFLYGDCTSGSEILWCLVPRMGHTAWPGGSGDRGGPVDGNARIWGFFEAHPLR